MKNVTRSLTLIGFLACLAGATCANADPSTKTSGPSTVSGDDMEVFQKAAQTGMLEVQAADIASSRALAPATKSFASAMTTDHSANNDALKALAASKGVTLPAQLDEKHRELLEKLQKEEPKEFDATYAKAMSEGHREAIELFKETVKETKDADIRAFATNTLPTLQHHLDMAKHLSGKN